MHTLDGMRWTKDRSQRLFSITVCDNRGEVIATLNPSCRTVLILLPTAKENCMCDRFDMEMKLLDMEVRIAELEREVGQATLPFVILETYEKNVARMKNIKIEDRQHYALNEYVDFLESVKREKDRDSYIWQKMKNWD